MFTRKLEKLIKVEKDHKLHTVNSFVLFNPFQTGEGDFWDQAPPDWEALHCRGDRNIKDTAARLKFKTSVDWQIDTFPLANQHF